MTALYIILGTIALIVILFSIKVSVTAEYADSFSLDVQWLFIVYRSCDDGKVDQTLFKGSDRQPGGSSR